MSTDCTDCNNKKSGHPPVRGGGFSPETFKHDFSLLGVILERSTKLDFSGLFWVENWLPIDNLHEYLGPSLSSRDILRSWDP